MMSMPFSSVESSFLSAVLQMDFILSLRFFGQLYDGIVGLLGCFFEMRGKVLAVALQTLEIDNPLFLFAEAENSIGVLVLIVEFPVFGIEFRLQVGILVMDVGQEADFGDFRLQAEKVGKDFVVSRQFI